MAKQQPTILGTNKEGYKALGQHSTYLICISMSIAVGIVGLIALIISKAAGISFIIFSILLTWIVRKWLKPVTGSYWKNK